MTEGKDSLRRVLQRAYKSWVGTHFDNHVYGEDIVSMGKRILHEQAWQFGRFVDGTWTHSRFDDITVPDRPDRIASGDGVVGLMKLGLTDHEQYMAILYESLKSGTARSFAAASLPVLSLREKLTDYFIMTRNFMGKTDSHDAALTQMGRAPYQDAIGQRLEEYLLDGISTRKAKQIPLAMMDTLSVMASHAPTQSLRILENVIRKMEEYDVGGLIPNSLRGLVDEDGYGVTVERSHYRHPFSAENVKRFGAMLLHDVDEEHFSPLKTPMDELINALVESPYADSLLKPPDAEHPYVIDIIWPLHARDEDHVRSACEAVREGVAKDMLEILSVSGFKHPDYDFLARIGSGAFGSTYLVRNKPLGAKRAIKIVETHQRINPPLLEGQVSEGLNHPHIARFYGVANIKQHQDWNMQELSRKNREMGLTVLDFSRPSLGLVMEYIKGKTLREALPDLSIHDRFKVMHQLVQGVHYLQTMGVVHHDLKPENIMLSDLGDVKIIDFGVASTTEIAHRSFATRMYAPPEFYEGKKAPNSDNWSLALLLDEIMAGNHLFLDNPESTLTTSIKNSVKGRVQEISQEEIHDLVKAREPLYKRRDLPENLGAIMVQLVREGLVIDPQMRIDTYNHYESLLGHWAKMPVDHL